MVITIEAEGIPIHYETVPPGLELVIAGEPEIAPFEREAIIGSLVGLGAPTPQLLGPVEYTFVSWSDGGAASHEVVAFDAPGTTYVATYVATHDLLRGDVNTDGGIDISDPIQTLTHLFDVASLDCEDAADANDDGFVNIGDPIFLLSYLFQMGVAPPPPFAGCGLDGTVDSLGCVAFGACP